MNLPDQSPRKQALIRLVPVAILIGLAIFISLDFRRISTYRFQAEQDAAAEMARAGEYEQALHQLEELQERTPDHLPLLWDRVVILSWAGQREEAISLASDLDYNEMPPWVLAELHRAETAHRLESEHDAAVLLARDGEYEQALEKLEALHRTEPDHLPLLWDRIAILCWAGRRQEAIALAANLDYNQMPPWILAELHRPLEEDLKPPNPQVERAVRQATPLRRPPPVRAPLPSETDDEATEDALGSWLETVILAYREDGDLDRAIRALRAKLEEEPEHLGLRGDLAVLLAEGGEHEGALDIASYHPWHLYSPYVLLSMGAIARHEGRVRTAISVYEAGCDRFPDNDWLQAGRIMALADQHRLARLPGDPRDAAPQESGALQTARAELARLRTIRGDIVPVLEAGAYLSVLTEDHVATVHAYQQLVGLEPESPYYTRELVFALQRAGHPSLALAFARLLEPEFTEEEWSALMVELAAFLVRLAVVQKYQPDGPRRFHEAQEALDEACLAAHRVSPGSSMLRRCMADRILLLTDFEHDDVAISHYEAHPAEYWPEYAHRTIAGAYMRTEDLTSCAQALTRAGALVTTLDKARLLMALEQHAEAERLLDQEIADQPPWIWGIDGEQYEENLDRLGLKQARLDSIAYTNRLALAIAEIDLMVAEAPANTGLRLQRAQYYRWHGWKRLAENEYQLLATLNDENLSLQRALIVAALEDGEYHAASDHLASWVVQHPLRSGREKMKATYRTAVGPYLYGNIGASHSDNGSLVEPGQGLTHEATIYSGAYTPWDDTRIFAGHRVRYGEYHSVTGSIYRQQVGAWHRRRDWQARLALTNRVDGPVGVLLAGAFQPHDRWRFDGDLQTDSEALPIRAAEADVTAHSARLGARYGVHDRHWYRVDTEAVWFSDQNRRRTLNLQAAQPLFHHLPHGLDLRQSLYWTSNTLTDRPYYSPLRQVAAMVHLDYHGWLAARFERRWTHRFTLGAGLSHQHGFGAHPIADLLYEHRFVRSRHMEWAIGASLYQRAYDGDSETNVSLYGEMLWRFH